MHRICVFCGSNPGTSPVYVTAARDLGRALVARNIELVFGGGRVGLMGAIADSVLEAGGRATGAIPRALVDKELAHNRVQELVVVASMHERKAKMADLSDAFVALPGGFGTFEEFFEVLTWSQLGLHAKPCGLLDVDGYYAPLIALADQATARGFVRPEHRANVLRERDPERLLDALASWRPASIEKWIGRAQS
jgi:uncharacterized protein (TIGR00730 family)